MNKQQIKINCWAQSAKGEDIDLYASAPLSTLAHQSPIIFVGGVQGDEPEGVELAHKWLNWLSNNEEIITPWILIPCINPDGYKINERTNGNGVDLNRNFPSRCWNREHSESRYFPGNSPASEPEVDALVDVIKEVKPQLIVHFHSWEPSIVYSNEKARWAAEHLEKSSGYRMQPDIGYPTPGSLGEYGGNDLDVGVICIEEQEGEPLEHIFPRFKQGLIDIIRANN